MDPKRRKIYLGIIIVCFASTGLLLLWNFGLLSSSPDTTVQINPSVNPSDPSSFTPSGTSIGSSPAVFPSTDKFKTQVLESEKYKNLVPYTPVDVTDQLGRPDPFRSF